MKIGKEQYVKARNQSGLDQGEAARLFGISQTAASHLETGVTKKIKPVYYALLVAWSYLPDVEKARLLAA